MSSGSAPQTFYTSHSIAAGTVHPGTLHARATRFGHSAGLVRRRVRVPDRLAGLIDSRGKDKHFGAIHLVFTASIKQSVGGGFLAVLTSRLTTYGSCRGD